MFSSSSWVPRTAERLGSPAEEASPLSPGHRPRPSNALHFAASRERKATSIRVQQRAANAREMPRVALRTGSGKLRRAASSSWAKQVPQGPLAGGPQDFRPLGSGHSRRARAFCGVRTMKEDLSLLMQGADKLWTPLGDSQGKRAPWGKSPGRFPKPEGTPLLPAEEGRTAGPLHPDPGALWAFAPTANPSFCPSPRRLPAGPLALGAQPAWLRVRGRSCKLAQGCLFPWGGGEKLLSPFCAFGLSGDFSSSVL